MRRTSTSLRVELGMSVRVKLVGVFQVLAGESEVKVRITEGATVSNVVQELVESFPTKFSEVLIDPGLGEAQPQALILVNGKEVGVLDGVGTPVRDGDEVVFVPVVHGG